MLKLGVDALPLAAKPSGIGRYTEQILTQLEFQTDCHLFSNKTIVTQLQKAKFHLFSGINIPKCLRKSIVWQQFFLPKILKNAHCDVFWSPRMQLPLLGCKNTPMVVTVHDLVYRKMPETMKYSNYLLEKLLLERSVKRADHIIADTEATKQSIVEELHVPEAKITVIHLSYVEIKDQPYIDLISLGITKPFVLFLGTLEPRKNIDRLISAYLALPQKLQDQYQLVLAGGSGWKSEDLVKRIKSLPQNKVLALGYLDDPVIYNLYKQATVFTFPSLYEGFGMPIIEAMSMGCPVLTSTDPACMEVSGTAALHVDPLSVESITRGLQKMLNDAQLRQEMIAVGFENIKRFSWSFAAQKHLEVFSSVTQL